MIRLLDDGANIDVAVALDKYSGPWTPLILASREGHMECVQVLLDRGANVNIQNEEVSAV